MQFLQSVIVPTSKSLMIYKQCLHLYQIYDVKNVGNDTFYFNIRVVGSLVVRASDSRPEVLGSMPDATKYPPSTRGVHARSITHNTPIVRNFLNQKFGARSIGRSGPIFSPPRSADLSLLDFFFYGAMKYNVYETPVDNEMVTSVIVRDMPGVFENVRWSMQHCRESCVRVNDRNFEHLL
ncbi:uncharacterized protein TNCV_3137681 [Trichonephila clavipes]|nr:uncharacterized protein TNCV_3137681 [Trichonephila clavipes]